MSDDPLTDFMSATTETVGSHREKLDSLDDRLAAIENMRPTAAAGRGRVTEPDGMPVADADRPRGPRAQVLGHASRHSSSLGFKSFGEFAMSVRQAGVQGGEVDERLRAAATSFGSESSGSDGGYLVPPDYRQTIMEKLDSQDSLIARTNQIVTASNSLSLPTSMSVPWDNTGIQAYWEGEADTLTQSKPNIHEVNMRLNKLAVLAPVTDELLEDSAAVGAYVSREAAAKIFWKTSYAIAWGTGAGQPLGYMNAPALVTQAAEASQVADSFVAANAVKMAARMPLQSRMSAVWLIHPDLEPQLPLMTVGDQPVFVGPGGFRDDPFGRLLGMPVIPHQVCETVGDLGDVQLVDLSQYLTAIKGGGVRSDVSIHLWFDQGITAFRFAFRVAGQPWWSEATTSRDGNFTQSPFVALAART